MSVMLNAMPERTTVAVSSLIESCCTSIEAPSA